MSGLFSSLFSATANPFGDSITGSHVMDPVSEEVDEDEASAQGGSVPRNEPKPQDSFGADGPTDGPPPARSVQSQENNYPAEYNFNRRTSVSAESLKPGAHNNDNWSPPQHDKTPDQLERLKAAIGSNFLFKHLEDEQSGQILGAMVEKPIPAKGIKVGSPRPCPRPARVCAAVS